jgi:hypothetical protein
VKLDGMWGALGRAGPDAIFAAVLFVLYGIVRGFGLDWIEASLSMVFVSGVYVAGRWMTLKHETDQSRLKLEAEANRVEALKATHRQAIDEQLQLPLPGRRRTLGTAGRAQQSGKGSNDGT